MLIQTQMHTHTQWQTMTKARATAAGAQERIFQLKHSVVSPHSLLFYYRILLCEFIERLHFRRFNCFLRVSHTKCTFIFHICTITIQLRWEKDDSSSSLLVCDDTNDLLDWFHERSCQYEISSKCIFTNINSMTEL
jgi:hypothetical protein